MSRCGTCQVLIEGPDAVRRHYNSELHLQNVRRRVEGLRPYTASELRQRHASGVDDDGTASTSVYSRARGHGEAAYQSPHAYAKEDAESAAASMAPMFSCTLCKKTFRSVQTLQAHVRSTAHLIRKEQRILARDADAASVLTTTSLGSAAMGLHRRHAAKMARGRVDELRRKTKLHAKANTESESATAAGGEGRSDLATRAEDASRTRCLFCGHASTELNANLDHMQRVHGFNLPMRAHCHDEGVW